VLNDLKLRALQTIYDRYIKWRLPEVVHPAYPIMLEYPIKPTPRYGHGKPAHPEISAQLARNDALYARTLASFSRFKESLLKIPEEPVGALSGEPYWNNTYFSAMDAISLYGFLGSKAPVRYMEVGSGNSTKFARRAIKDLNLSTKITSLDPNPRAEVDALCDRVIRQPLEDLDGKLFDELEAGDILFIDNSHRAFQNSDVTVFFLEILPRLKPGITVHIHDIFLPFDYPPLWSNRHYSEQYLLAAFLLADYDKFEILLPLAYACKHPSIGKEMLDAWTEPLFERAFAVNRRCTEGYIGASFWLTTK
jgi:Methyltransferase domain